MRSSAPEEDAAPADRPDRWRPTSQGPLEVLVQRLQKTLRDLGEVRAPSDEHKLAASRFLLEELAGALDELKLSHEEELRSWNAELERRVAARSEELEEASRNKDEFMATVSHELRTPLNAFSAWLYLLRGGKLDAQQTIHALDTLDATKNALAQLTDDLLDLSRFTSGKLRLDLAPLELGPVIQAAAESLRPAMEAKAIHFRTEIDPRAGKVFGDAVRLQQVVWNLLANSLKFTPQGGEVEIVVHRFTEGGEEFVQLCVHDTGKGIDSELLPLIFEPFRQGEQSSRRQRGLGLGLAIVHYLVDAHGGKVFAQSRGDGQGATFKVRLPPLQIDPITGDVA